VPGLRREEVALLAGPSPDYYARLERGVWVGRRRRLLEAVAALNGLTMPCGSTCSTSLATPQLLLVEDFTGKTVHPFVTYAVSGLGSNERDYTASCAGARIRPALAVQGEEVTRHRARAHRSFFGR